MKILVVHEVSYLRKVVYEIHEFPELLALRGHQVTFMDFDEGAKRASKKVDRDRMISGRVHSQAKLRLVTPHAFGIPAVDRLWALISSLPVLLRLLRKGEFDVVLNFAVPTYGLQVNLIARIFGVPVVHRALDVSSHIRQSVWNPLIAVWERMVFHLSSSISANNPAMAGYVKAELGSASLTPVEVNYPPLDLGICRPEPYDTALANSLGIERTEKVLVYMGSFFYFSGLDDVIRALSSAVQRSPDIKLLLIGGGEQEHQLRLLVKSLGLEKQVVFTGFVPFTELSRFMSLADMAINPLRPEKVASMAFPQKVLQYLGTGLPVVSTKLDGLVAAFDGSNDIVWANSPSDAAEIAIQFLEAGNLPSKFEMRHVPQVLVQLFSPESATRSLEAHLNRIAVGSRKG
jgi:glycosyltransferase involved in cell wall biosynthesis